MGFACMQKFHAKNVMMAPHSADLGMPAVQAVPTTTTPKNPKSTTTPVPLFFTDALKEKIGTELSPDLN